MNNELKDISGKLEKYLKEDPKKAKAAWDKITREHEEHFIAWRDALTPEHKKEILDDHEDEVLRREFAGPSAKEHLWHGDYTIRIHDLYGRIAQLERGEKGKVAVILKHFVEGVQVKHRRDCDITCGRTECNCDWNERQKELSDALVSLKAVPPAIPLDAIMEGVCEGLGCVENGEDPIPWIRSCLSRYRFIR